MTAQANAKILHPPQNLIPGPLSEKYNLGAKSGFTKHNRLLTYPPINILNASFIKKEQFLMLDNLFSKAR
jgi:hypothetical protein